MENTPIQVTSTKYPWIISGNICEFSLGTKDVPNDLHHKKMNQVKGNIPDDPNISWWNDRPICLGQILQEVGKQLAG